MMSIVTYESKTIMGLVIDGISEWVEFAILTGIVASLIVYAYRIYSHFGRAPIRQSSGEFEKI